MSDVGEVAKAIAPLIDNLAKLTGPLCEEVGLYFGDNVRAFRQRNVTKVIDGSVKLLEGAGKPVDPVPPRLLLPMLDAASLEDNPTLQKMWIGLLASASDQADDMSPSYIDTLKSLKPIEARALRIVYDGGSHLTLGTEDEVASRIRVGLGYSDAIPAGLDLMLDTFERLGLFRRQYDLHPRSPRPKPPSPSTALTFDTSSAPRFGQKTVVAFSDTGDINLDVDWSLSFTTYGIEFMLACQGPEASTTREEQ